MTVIRSVPRVSAFTAAAIVLFACAGPAASPSRAPSSAPQSAAAATTRASAPATATTSAASATPGATATAAITEAPSAEPTGPVTGSLNVLEWSGYEEELYWADFAEKYPDVDVSFDFGISDADIYGKMKAGSQADVFHPYTGWLQFYVDEGLVSEIDTTRLANWDKVPDYFKAVGQLNGKQYFVPFDWGFTSILYRTDKVDPVTSWSVLFDEQYDNHIAMWDDGPGAVTVSSYIHGYDETAVTDEQLQAIQAEWSQQAPLNALYWASEYADLVPAFQSGDVWLAYAWQGAYATLLGEGMEVAYADPEEGRNSWVGVYGISSDSPNYDLALRFLDEKLGVQAGVNTIENFYYGHVSTEAQAQITDETLIEAFSIDDPTVLERTNFTPNLTADQRDAWTQMWAEVKASQ
jgi:spermidine/putrescine transport system substrate-binding protein